MDRNSSRFRALRRLTPAKLEGRDRGDLISLITADIEALEVFYAHTISPICIAFICVIGMTGFVGSWHILPALVLLAGYLLVGVALPVWSAKRGDRAAREYRQALADTNSYVLESLRGLKDTLQYQDTAARAEGITAHSEMLGEKQKAMKYREGLTVAITNTLILLTVLANTAAAIYSSPLGQALSAAGISEAAFNANLQTQYQSFAASATSATTLLNSQTTAALNQVGGNIVRIDTDRLFADMLASPERYGLANTTAPACSGSTAQSLCRPADAAQADSRLFADGFHPGPAAHQIMADYIINTLQAPQDMAALRRSVMEQSRNVQDFVREESNRQRSNPQAPHQPDGLQIALAGALQLSR